MSLNDGQHDEFNSELEDEYIFDAHYPPGVEIGAGFDESDEESPDDQPPLDLKHDYGSGSYAEDGRLEVAEDNLMMNGESQLGSAAMYGPTEIGADDDFEQQEVYLEHQYEIGAADRGYGSEIGSTESADRGGSEIGDARNNGYIAKYGPSEIGAAAAADRDGYEIGAADRGYGSEIGADSADVMAPFESFMLDDVNMGEKFSHEFGIDAVGGDYEDGYGDAFYKRGYKGSSDEYSRGYDTATKDTAVGAAAAADRPGYEIGASPALAVAKVVEKARDNRQPPPPMRAVDAEAMMDDDYDYGMTDMMIGVADVTGNPDPFPLTSQLMLRAGASTAPRFVRVDTEESYKVFRTENSPELAELAARLDAHMADPYAHGNGQNEPSSDLSDDIEELVHIGAEADAAEDAKRIDLWMPKRFDGLVTAWKENGFVCTSMTLPGHDGEVRICTSLEPIVKCVSEMSRHAAESGVPASTVVGVISEMGCVLGAGTALKEMAAAAPAILARPEAQTKMPFMVRIEPKLNPALGALMMLVAACRQGNQQACAEWQKLGELSAGPVKQAMAEALQLAKAAGA